MKCSIYLLIFFVGFSAAYPTPSMQGDALQDEKTTDLGAVQYSNLGFVEVQLTLVPCLQSYVL
jgi:hypothetical protein